MINQGDKVTLKPGIPPVAGRGVYTGYFFEGDMVGEVDGKHIQGGETVCLVRAWQHKQGEGLMQFLVPINLLMPSTDTTHRVRELKKAKG